MSEPSEELEGVRARLAETEAALLRSEKMATLGRLVAGVAHEVHTPLGSIHANCDLMLRGLEKVRELLGTGVQNESDADGELEKLLDALEEAGRVNRTACDRILSMAKGLKSFARVEQEKRQSCDLHEILEGALALVGHELKSRVEITRDYGKIPPVDCFPGLLGQIFVNLLVNASQAIEGKGEIRIATRSRGDDVEVVIEDDGSGIAPEHLDRVFDEGFTTKANEEGTGLGLAICRKAVDAHHGKIEVRSNQNDGTRFTLTLPVRVASEPEN